MEGRKEEEKIMEQQYSSPSTSFNETDVKSSQQHQFHSQQPTTITTTLMDMNMNMKFSTSNMVYGQLPNIQVTSTRMSPNIMLGKYQLQQQRQVNRLVYQMEPSMQMLNNQQFSYLSNQSANMQPIGQMTQPSHLIHQPSTPLPIIQPSSSSINNCSSTVKSYKFALLHQIIYTQLFIYTKLCCHPEFQFQQFLLQLQNWMNQLFSEDHLLQMKNPSTTPNKVQICQQIPTKMTSPMKDLQVSMNQNEQKNPPLINRTVKSDEMDNIELSSSENQISENYLSDTTSQTSLLSQTPQNEQSQLNVLPKLTTTIGNVISPKMAVSQTVPMSRSISHRNDYSCNHNSIPQSPLTTITTTIGNSMMTGQNENEKTISISQSNPQIKQQYSHQQMLKRNVVSKMAIVQGPPIHFGDHLKESIELFVPSDVYPEGIDLQLILDERQLIIEKEIEHQEKALKLEGKKRSDEEKQSPSYYSYNNDVRFFQEEVLLSKLEEKALSLRKRQESLRRRLLVSYFSRTRPFNRDSPNSYVRIKDQTLKDVRSIERYERRLNEEKDYEERQQRQEFLMAIIQQTKMIRERTKLMTVKAAKVVKSAAAHHAAIEREQKKEAERLERERIKKLIDADENGYMKLIDQEKDRRLAYLLKQTDEYVGSLTKLVQQHQTLMVKKKQPPRHKTQNNLSQQESSIQNKSIHRILHFINKINSSQIKSVEGMSESEKEKWLNNEEWQPIYLDSTDETPATILSNSFDPDADPNDVRLEEEIDETKIVEEVKEMVKSDHDPISYYAVAHRINESVTEQAIILEGGSLKEYQVKGLEWLISLYNNNLNGILADEMGLGKTIQTIALITYLMEKKRVNGPYLIIVPLSTLSNWENEFARWAPKVMVVAYRGKPVERRQISLQLKTGKFNVLLTTFDYIIKDKTTLSKTKWKYMIIDEGHRMKNHQCKLTIILSSNYTADHRLLLTGTPLQNKLPELWSLMNFLLPSIFQSVSTFEQWFNSPFANTGEKMELNQEETLLIIRRLHKVLRPFLLRRLKKEVESQLPDKVEYVIKCNMSDLQKQLYVHMQNSHVLLTDDMASTKSNAAKTGGKRLMNIIMQLRKICNHPFMFANIEEAIVGQMQKKGYQLSGADLYRASGKFELLDRLLPKLKASNHKVLLFCQMTATMTIIEDYFHYRKFRYLRLDGTTRSTDRGDMLAKFNNPKDDYFIFLLSTRAGGLGLNLQSADTVIIFDSDWNPHQDLQAQDRAHRIGQQNEVRVLRLMTVNSVEERILQAARFKLNVDQKVIQAGKFDQKSTAEERHQFLAQIIHDQLQQDDEEDPVPDDEQINQMILRHESEVEIFKRVEKEIEERTKLELGGRGRLILMNELPDWMLRNDDYLNKLKSIGKEDKKRERKKVLYNEDCTDDTFLNELVDDSEDIDQPSKIGRNRKKKKINNRRESSSSSSILSTRSSNMRKRKQIQMNQSITECKRSRKTLRTTGKINDLTHIMTDIIKFMKKYHANDEHRPADAFYKLPSKHELPDYYQIIQQPIDIFRIEKRIQSGRYETMDDIEYDVKLMCENARIYNEDKSLIFKDSIVLWKLFKDGRHIHEKQLKQITDDDDDDENDKMMMGNDELKKNQISSDNEDDYIPNTLSQHIVQYQPKFDEDDDDDEEDDSDVESANSRNSRQRYSSNVHRSNKKIDDFDDDLEDDGFMNDDTDDADYVDDFYASKKKKNSSKNSLKKKISKKK
ncbi:hypothetical protein SNEBB_000984 [Seison nebaliae]|nr:hypothetical protein SNEBB_000984 [Seison nebaliae]